LVTGATGMVGSKLVLDLIEAGLGVRAIYRDKRRIGQFKENVQYYGADSTLLENQVEWVEADLLDYLQLAKALEGVEMVYHCAAMVSFHPSERGRMFENNINGTSNLVNICLEKGIKKICYVSSIAALGKTENGGLINEETSWIPEKKHSSYSISKFHSEMEIWRGVNEGLDAVIVNPSVIIGPGDWSSGSPAFFGTIAKGLKFFTDGVNGFVDVRDVTSAMILLTSDSNFEKAKNNRFLLNSANMGYKLFFEQIAKSVRVNPPTLKASKIMLETGWRMAKVVGFLTRKKPIITKETAHSATGKSVYDGSKITREFGFQYRPIEQTITEVGGIFLTTKKLG